MDVTWAPEVAEGAGHSAPRSGMVSLVRLLICRKGLSTLPLTRFLQALRSLCHQQCKIPPLQALNRDENTGCCLTHNGNKNKQKHPTGGKWYFWGPSISLIIGSLHNYTILSPYWQNPLLEIVFYYFAFRFYQFWKLDL